MDLLVGLRGLDPDAFSRTVELIFHEVELRVIGLEDFIAMKVFAGRPQDLADARAAITATADRPDLPLATTLARRFGPDVAVTLGRIVAENSVKKLVWRANALQGMAYSQVPSSVCDRPSARLRRVSLSSGAHCEDARGATRGGGCCA